jgi:nucleotide-binding universal stress UspA family protein
MIALRTVLVATDFSDASEAALRYGRALAHVFGASLHVLHVVPDPLSFSWAGVPEAGASPTLRHEWTTEAHNRLELLLTPQDRSMLHAQLAVRTGDPVRQILEYALQNRVGLAVLGTRGKGPVEHLLLGSVAERVVRFAPCPVLTVRPQQQEFVRESHAPATRAVFPREAVTV